MKKCISVYLKAGKNAATSYYRFYQFFDGIEARFMYHLMIPDSLWNSFFPISKQPFQKKVFIFFFIYFRTLMCLLRDTFLKPSYIVISRCLINKVFPYSYRFLLYLNKKRGVQLIFDFDDNIIISGEVTRKGLDYFTHISDIIIAGSPLLLELINEDDSHKGIFLPTTDGDLYGHIDNCVLKKRLDLFRDEIQVTWIGTFSGLEYLLEVMPAFEELGRLLKNENKYLVLTVVCDYPLDYHPDAFSLKNIKWTRQVAIESMLNAHIGIMPLRENESTRGKCSFKLIQYLSAGLPVVGTLVGMNKMVINDNVGVGLNNNSPKDWATAIYKIVMNSETWACYSKNASSFWQDNFSFNYNLKKWSAILS